MKLKNALLIGFAAPVALGVGCSSIPDVTFIDDATDGGSVVLADGAVVPKDAATDTSKPDTGTKPDASTPDAATPSCPQAVPQGYVRCCGSVPCAGDDCEVNCGECQTKCGTNEGCCSRKNNVTCRPRSSFVCN
ncbi:MAG: hypothetical protein IPK71_35800 [Myxococcales bacterium]|nr:hypothetical protein [Myxococcales bacterium]